jgi:hypothetical protein
MGNPLFNSQERIDKTISQMSNAFQQGNSKEVIHLITILRYWISIETAIKEWKPPS